jgi:transcriptional regulator with XRE-family HTH domain
MPSGRKPNLQRRRHVLRLRGQGHSFTEIARRLGVTKQAVWSLLNARPRLTQARAVACTGCGQQIVSPGALRRDAGSALCLTCLDGRADVAFGPRLKALRLAAGLSQADLSKRSGIPPGSIRTYEDGSRSPRRRSIDRLARVLGHGLLRGWPEVSAKGSAARRGRYCTAS